VQHAQNWRLAASQPVLIGVLRRGYEKEHLDWIRRKSVYYMRLLKTQSRQFMCRWVALYSPLALRRPGAVTHCAEVRSVRVLPRAEIDTPWPAQHSPNELCIQYELGSLEELSIPKQNQLSTGRGQRFSTHRWTTYLALERATTLAELLLETEPEWRLYERFRASGISFDLRPIRPRGVSDQEQPRGRVWFDMGSGVHVRHAGAGGYGIRIEGRTRFVANFEDLFGYLEL
jgi:hypothetical protein